MHQRNAALRREKALALAQLQRFYNHLTSKAEAQRQAQKQAQQAAAAKQQAKQAKQQQGKQQVKQQAKQQQAPAPQERSKSEGRKAKRARA
jgi:hypothetical protein